MKRTPLRRRTPLRKGTGRLQRTPLRSMSRKRSKQQRRRQTMVQHELANRPRCEAGPLIYQYRLTRYGDDYGNRLNANSYPCGQTSVELHEPLTRARGGSILDPANTVAICRSCHDWVHDHSTAATELGLLRSA